MKKITLILLTSTSLTVSGFTLAGDDCQDPINTWQPRETLQLMLEKHGWQVDRIKVDDGCYEVKGTDTLGNRFEATYSPATLHIRELDIKFKGQGSATQYLDRKNPLE
ncbi:PepSY domain-containing protein [Nitrincola tapanii]|uniref:PepSY domain-containing protein n=1 Tax=Nitrincola tapanii TaxID=1708751 RepID=A0A5A9W4G4_9GAMM|nr:PepSY domain-containing protein [Nitrincola tapanii]KAA0875025.1 PepSY domain-containing protein [Nitrincola tapanii]